MGDDPTVIKIRGMPYEATAMEVCRFFKDCEIVGGPNGIYFCLNEKGLPTGEAFIEMESQDDIDKALDKHKEEMGRRYIEVFESRKSVMDKVKRGGGEGRDLRDRSPRDRRDRRDRCSEYCVKLRGLPWEATTSDIMDFFHRCNIEGGSRGIHITMDDRGRASGDAFVELETSEDMDEALKMHKRDMGSRYIEVFEANPLDVNRSRDGGGRGGGYGRDERRGRARGYTVTLRGLPYRSSEREIADWLSEAADPLEVIIEMDRTGRPSGQAEAVFASHRDAKRVVDQMHKRDLGHRYIECLYDDDRD